MWTEFEWENKVNVNTNIDDLRACASPPTLSRSDSRATLRDWTQR